jgi:hypothetical protein
MRQCIYQRWSRRRKCTKLHCAKHNCIIQLDRCLSCKDFVEGYGDISSGELAHFTKEGAGDRLHAAIKKRLKELPNVGCNCEQHIREMNSWGYEKCVENIDTIVSWMQAEAIKRKWKLAKFPLAKYAIKQFVLRAIKE